MAEDKKKRKTKSQTRLFQTVRGMHDVLPEEQPWWARVLGAAEEIASSHGFGRIEPPVLEFAALYEKGTGLDTDVVGKEMYTLRTRGRDLLALRPEYTPGVLRSYLEHGLSRFGQPQKLYSMGPVFRHEAPQAGRYRQFSQVNFEIIGGPNDPVYDAEVLVMFSRLLSELKIKRVTLKLNSIGCRVCRPLYRRQLQGYFRHYEKKLCPDCERRLKSNPLRLFDCKEEQCQPFKAKAPNVLDRICVTCSNHFKGALEYLDELSISYFLDPQLVRGLDYYSKTVFEFYVEGEGSEVGALPAGGRYDYLAELLGGRFTPAVGGACGIERLIHVMKVQGVKLPGRGTKKVFLIHVGDMAKKRAMKLLRDLREAGISVAESLGRESLKAQLKAADREGAELALILGQKELFEEHVIVRDLKRSLQESVPIARLVEEVKKRLRQ